MLVGNSYDRVTEREVSMQKGLALARELDCEFVEASTKNCIEKASLYSLWNLLQQEQGKSHAGRSSSFYPTKATVHSYGRDCENE